MKVKKEIVRFMHEIKIKFCYIAFILVFLSFCAQLLHLHEVNAYFNETVEHLKFNAYDVENKNAGNRSGKFLFDALFGIEQPLVDDELDDDDDIVKACNCGKWVTCKKKKKNKNNTNNDNH